MSQEDISPDLKDSLERRQQTQSSGSLVLSDTEAFVGEQIRIRGVNLPENEQLDLIWHTAQGRWGVLKANDVIGPQYQPRTKRLAGVTTDGEGNFTKNWRIPEDYGGEHTIELQARDGASLAKTKLTINPWFKLDRIEAPMGEAFRITGFGLGPSVLTNNYQISWDNGVVGFMTGVMNQGTATAEIRAVGPVGEHVIQVWRNFRGVPFLQNNTQSPFGPVAGERSSSWTVTVREPEETPKTAWMDSLMDEAPLDEHYPAIDRETDAELTITPTSGQPGTTAIIQGRQFPAETEVDLIWYTHEGHRIMGVPITPHRKPDVLPVVTTDEKGTFEVEVTIPNEQGATRPITAEIDGESVAVTGFMLQPKIVSISPTKGPVGTDIEFKFTGVGWPKYENAYFFVYDNKPVGYVCSIDNEDGIIRTELKATGEPGWHFIDVYPGIFDMEEDEPDFELKPHLSYLDNHPVRPLPALHFAIEVTE